MCNCKPGGDARPCSPSDLSDAVWEVIEPLMPARDRSKGGAPRKYDDRLAWDTIFYVLRSGCQWRMIPRDLLPWDAAYRRYRTWKTDGTPDRIHDTLRAEVREKADRDPNPTAAVLDSQPILTGEGGQARGYDTGKRTKDRKRHLAVDALGLVLVVAVTSTSAQDRPGGRRVLEALADRLPTVGLVRADTGYADKVDSGLLTWAYETCKLVVEIVRRGDDTKGFQVLPRRRVVERTFAWLVRNRRLARDYERLTDNSEAMVKLAMIRLTATRLADQSPRWSNRPADQTV